VPLPAVHLQPIYGPRLCLAARCLRLSDVRSSGGSHLPPAADTGSAVVPDNQPQSVERLKFLQDGSLARAISGVNRQVYPPGVPVPATLGDDRQEFDLTIGKRFGRQDYLDRLTSS